MSAYTRLERNWKTRHARWRRRHCMEMNQGVGEVVQDGGKMKTRQYEMTEAVKALYRTWHNAVEGARLGGARDGGQAVLTADSTSSVAGTASTAAAAEHLRLERRRGPRGRVFGEPSGAALHGVRTGGVDKRDVRVEQRQRTVRQVRARRAEPPEGGGDGDGVL